jgi:hypothetical protein
MSELADFDIQVNVGSGVPIDVMMQDPSEGAHQVEIMAVRMVTKEGENGKTSLRFSVSDIEPGSPTFGVQTQVVIGTDWSKPFNVGHLVNSLLSIGASPDKVKGIIRVVPGIWIGKKAHIYVKAKPEGELDADGKKTFADKNFITPSQYEAAKKAATLRVVSPAAKTGGAPTVLNVNGTSGVPSAPAAPVTTGPSQPAADLGNLFS